jgi:hypothetical protein
MTRAADVAGRLAERADAVAISLLGKPSTTNRRELRFGNRGSLSLRLDGAKRGHWFDHKVGNGGDLLHLVARQHGVQLGEAMRIAERDYLGEVLRQPAAKPRSLSDRSKMPDEGGAARRQAALQLWAESRPLSGTLGERYFLEQRQLDIRRLRLDHVLRWHAGRSCVVGLMTDVATGVTSGIHRTFIAADGAKIERKMLGRKGCIRLSLDEDVTLGLGLVEGIEDGLAVLLSGWAPVWAAADAGAVAGFPVLPGLECLTVFADADAAGMKAARRCAARWAESCSTEVRISPPARSRADG